MEATRRTIVQGVSAMVGAAALGAPAAATPGSAPRWDVIVAGAGTAGLPTAIFAAARGARVLLIEKSARIGGTLINTSGQIAAAGTRFQAALGIADTPEAHFQDAMRICGDTADPAVVRLYTRHAAAIVDWMQDQGFRLKPGHPTAVGYNATFGARRFMEGVDEGRGVIAAFAPSLRAAVESGAVTLAVRTSVHELVRDAAGAVTGVVTRDEDGAEAVHSARSVVLTTGGFAANPALYEEMHGVPMYAREAWQFNDGAGLQAAMAVGAETWNRDRFVAYYGAVLTDENYPSPRIAVAALDPRFREPWEIMVNLTGQRFLAEDGKALRPRLIKVREQPRQRYWIVFDSEILAKAPPLFPSLSREVLDSHLRHHPSFATADTVEELAVGMGVPPAALARTVGAYNQSVANAVDPLGRRHLPLPIARSPFHAVQQHGWSMVSYAGLRIDDTLRVLRADGRPVPNLYAAGEIVGAYATTGDAPSNGGNVTPALTFGYLLGARLLPINGKTG